MAGRSAWPCSIPNAVPTPRWRLDEVGVGEGLLTLPGGKETAMVSRMERGDPRLPFPTRPLKVGDATVEEYVIPEDKKAEVLEQLYPFTPVPSLDAVMLDIHEDKTFTVREFRVTREGDENWLVSPYYPTSGGTVIDWWPEDEDDEEYDEEAMLEEFGEEEGEGGAP